MSSEDQSGWAARVMAAAASSSAVDVGGVKGGIVEVRKEAMDG
jgi:hypothetical protein